MSASDFTAMLEAALETRLHHFVDEVLPSLKQEFQRFHGSCNNLLNVLLQKGLIQEDPYKHDEKLSEIVLPSNEQFIESEMSEQIGIRLSQFESQLSFLESYYQFSIDFLSLKRLKLLAGLVKFVDWGGLSATSTRANTRGLAIIVDKIKGGTDAFTSRVIVDVQQQMSEATKKILSLLQDIGAYHRENYKLEARKEILSHIELPDVIADSDIESALSAANKAHGSHEVSIPFYQELVREVIVEDHTREGMESREEILAKLAVQKKEQKQKARVTQKPDLMEAVRILSTTWRHLDGALKKLNANTQYYEDQRSSGGGFFRRLLSRLVSTQKQKRVYEVEFLDVATSVSRSEKVDYLEFAGRASQITEALKAFASKSGPQYTTLAESEDNVVYEVVEKLVVELQRILKTIPALQEFISSELPAEVRSKLNGTKLEVNAMQNAVLRANQRRHEYVSHVEEEAQLKKLGIDAAQKSAT